MKRVYLGNLPWKVTEDEIRDFLDDGGTRTVTKVNIILGEDGRPRGFGFAEFKTDEEARSAIEELDGATLNEREISVSEARERQRRDDAPSSRTMPERNSRPPRHNRNPNDDRY